MAVFTFLRDSLWMTHGTLIARTPARVRDRLKCRRDMCHEAEKHATCGFCRKRSIVGGKVCRRARGKPPVVMQNCSTGSGRKLISSPASELGACNVFHRQSTHLFSLSVCPSGHAPHAGKAICHGCVGCGRAPQEALKQRRNTDNKDRPSYWVHMHTLQSDRTYVRSIVCGSVLGLCNVFESTVRQSN